MKRAEIEKKLREWEAEGYDVSEFRNKWFPEKKRKTNWLAIILPVISAAVILLVWQPWAKTPLPAATPAPSLSSATVSPTIPATTPVPTVTQVVTQTATRTVTATPTPAIAVTPPATTTRPTTIIPETTTPTIFSTTSTSNIPKPTTTSIDLRAVGFYDNFKDTSDNPTELGTLLFSDGVANSKYASGALVIRTLGSQKGFISRYYLPFFGNFILNADIFIPPNQGTVTSNSAGLALRTLAGSEYFFLTGTNNSFWIAGFPIGKGGRNLGQIDNVSFNLPGPNQFILLKKGSLITVSLNGNQLKILDDPELNQDVRVGIVLWSDAMVQLTYEFRNVKLLPIQIP